MPLLWDVPNHSNGFKFINHFFNFIVHHINDSLWLLQHVLLPPLHLCADNNMNLWWIVNALCAALSKWIPTEDGWHFAINNIQMTGLFWNSLEANLLDVFPFITKTAFFNGTIWMGCAVTWNSLKISCLIPYNRWANDEAQNLISMLWVKPDQTRPETRLHFGLNLFRKK